MQNFDDKILTSLSYNGETNYHISEEKITKNVTYISQNDYEQICDKYLLQKISYNNFQGFVRIEYKILNK